MIDSQRRKPISAATTEWSVATDVPKWFQPFVGTVGSDTQAGVSFNIGQKLGKESA